ncbi:hypothetical protein ACFLR1_06800 [Bacteroidota bacterium]
MDFLLGTTLTFGYTALFLLAISKMAFFRVGKIPVSWFQGAFVLKVLSGFLLYLVYTYYYTDRSTADIWKYYDDGMVLYSALSHHPTDFLKMLFGIGNDTPHFEQYYNQMNHWYRPYGSSIANDTHTIIRFNAFARLLSFGHYNVHSVMVNFLGLIGLTGILHFLRLMSPAKEKWFFVCVFLMPGIMFWASGVLKEPLLLFGLGLFLFSVWKMVDNGLSISKAGLLFISLFVLITVKSYALIAIIPGLFAWFVCNRFPKARVSMVFIGAYVLLVVGILAADSVSPDKSPVKRLARKQHEFYQLAEGGTYVRTSENDTLYIGPEFYDAFLFVSNREKIVLQSDVQATSWEQAKQVGAPLKDLRAGSEYEILLDYGRTGSTINIPKLEANAWSVLKAVPLAFVNAAFRPFPWNIRSPFMLLSGIENIILMLLFLAAGIRFLKNPFGHSFLKSKSVFYVAILFAATILILTGLVTPVVGAIVRYKVPALPFLVCGLLAVVDTGGLDVKLSKRFPFFKRYF